MPVKCDTTERVEQIFQHAEIKANARQDFSDEVESSHKKFSYAPAPDLGFVLAAKRELEHRALRTRFLPVELFAERGWVVLLDLFISEAQPGFVNGAQCGCRWNLSPATFARVIATLIEEGLLVRVFDEENDEASARFRLTRYGHEQICSVLRHF
jgi:hypothetical protein